MELPRRSADRLLGKRRDGPGYGPGDGRDTQEDARDAEHGLGGIVSAKPRSEYPPFIDATLWVPSPCVGAERQSLC